MVEAEKMRTIMDFQWACLCIHKIAGGGRPEEPEDVYIEMLQKYQEEL